MSFNIEQLKVNLYTNLEGKNKNIVLTKKIIYYPDTKFENLNEYPYFTSDIIYPISIIYINLPTYKERVELFFDKAKFNEILSSITFNSDSKKDTKDYNAEQNIMIMLEILFPTKFPAIKNLHESYNIVLGTSSITNHIFNPAKTRNFSYLKIDGKVYTTKKVILLNDILNNPLYRDLLENYRKFWLWTQEEKSENIKLIDKSIYEILEYTDIILNNITGIINITVASNEGKSLFFEKVTQKKGKEISETVKYIIKFYKIHYLINKIIKANLDSGINIKVDNNELNAELQRLLEIERKNIDLEIKEINEDKKKIFIVRKIVNNIKLISTNFNVLLLENSVFYKEKKIANRIGKELVTNNNNPSIKQISETININYDKITTIPLNNYNNKYNKIYDLFEKKYDVIEKEYSKSNLQIPSEYRNFAYGTLNQYRKPFRITTNVLLQNLINGSDNANTKEFYNFMRKTYEFYMKNNKEYTLTTQEKKLLKVNINYINTNATSGVKREIYVLVDFIEGEINDINVKTIYCPFTNEHLGNELDYLLRNAVYNKKQMNMWEVNRNRMKFNIETNDNKKISEKENILVAKPITNDNVDETKVEVLFLEKVLKNNEKITTVLTELNKIIRGELVYENNILDFLKKNNNELYKVIVKWTERPNEKSDALLNHMIKTKSGYNAQTQILNKELENHNVQSNELIKNLKLYEKTVYRLYKRILTALIDNESRKKGFLKSLNGGNKTKRKGNAANNKTRKSKNM